MAVVVGISVGVSVTVGVAVAVGILVGVSVAVGVAVVVGISVGVSVMVGVSPLPLWIVTLLPEALPLTLFPLALPKLTAGLLEKLTAAVFELPGCGSQVVVKVIRAMGLRLGMLGKGGAPK